MTGIYPAAAAATGFDWDISGSGSVDISDNGTITALKAGAVNIAAVAKGSGAVSNTVTLTVNSAIDGYSLISGYEVFGRTDDKWEAASPPENAFDGNVSTVYDGQAGGYCGMVFDEPQKIAAIRYQSGDGYEERMPGCEFQVSQDGEEYTTVYTIESVEPNGEWNYILLEDFDPEIRDMLENNEYRYFRFYGNEFAPIAELSVYTKAEEEPETETGLAVTDDSGNEIAAAGDAAAAGHINIEVSVSAGDSGKELIMYAAQYDESGALIRIDMFDGIKDGDKKETDISPDCGRIALYLWDTEQAPVIGEVELN